MPLIVRNCRRTSSTIKTARFTDRFHTEGAENKRQHAAKEQPDQHFRIGEIEGGQRRIVRRDFARIFGEQHDGRKTGRADRIAFRHRLRRIADRIERIGDVSDGFAQMRHLCDAAGIVRDRTERIDRHDDAGHREHRHRRHRHAIESARFRAAADPEAAEDRRGDDDDRGRGRLHPDREPGNDVRRMTRFTRFGNVLHRRITL